LHKSKLVSPVVTFILGATTALALAAPGVIQLTSDEEPVTEESEVVAPCPEQTPDGEATESAECDDNDEPEDDSDDESAAADEPDDDQEQDDNDDAEGDHPDNHGAAVSTAAHCPIKGREHGELVRSIAHDKDATVADAKAACEAALAAQEEQESDTESDSDDDGHGKPSWAGQGNGHSKEKKEKKDK
jgi:hypothetical protein